MASTYKKRAARGAIWKIKASGTSSYTQVPGIKDFTIDWQPERDEIDATTHDSPDGNEETLLGIGRFSASDIPIIWDSANAEHQALVAAAQSGEPIDSQFEFVDGLKLEGPLLIKKVTIDNPVNDAYSATISIKWPSSPTVTEPSP